MKYLAILFLTLSSLNLNNVTTNDTVDIITSGKWFVKSMQMGKEKIDLPKEQQKGFYMIFKANGKYKMVAPGDTSTAKWEYNVDSNSITLKSKNDTVEMKIISIDRDNLVLDSVFQGQKVILNMHQDI